MTNEEIIQRGQLINDETEPAQNTSERVGGVIKGIGQNLADKDTAIAAEAARNGYYQCTVNSNQLAVTAPRFTLPAHGGNIRIKMSAPATGACTLNINGTGAKALLYNGAAVSSVNTWEQNEIISVFYDPSGSGQYLASNSQGGGGKAEKIKYDNSQSGIASENVQGALDEVSVLGDKCIDSENTESQLIAQIGSWNANSGSIGTKASIRAHLKISASGYNRINVIIPRNYYAQFHYVNSSNVSQGRIGDEWYSGDITLNLSGEWDIMLNIKYQEAGSSKITAAMLNYVVWYTTLSVIDGFLPATAYDEHLAFRRDVLSNLSSTKILAQSDFRQGSNDTEGEPTSNTYRCISLLRYEVDENTLLVVHNNGQAHVVLMFDDNDNISTTGWVTKDKVYTFNNNVRSVRLLVSWNGGVMETITPEQILATFQFVYKYDIIKDLDSSIQEVAGKNINGSQFDFTQGSNDTEGEITPSTYRCITLYKFDADDNTILTINNNGQAHVMLTYDEDGVIESTTGWVKDDGTYKYKFPSNKKFRIVASWDGSTTRTITPKQVAVTFNIHKLGKIDDEGGTSVSESNDSFCRFNKKISVYNPYKNHPQNQYKGQMHCHTTNSDGALAPAAVVAKYVGYGYDFMTITDHNYITPNPSPNADIVWMGNSYEDTWNAAGHQHMNVWNCAEIINKVNQYTTSNTPQMLVNHYVKNGDSVLSYNHPEYPPVYASDGTLENLPNGISFVEIYNSTIQTFLGTVQSLPTTANCGDMVIYNGTRYINTSITKNSPNWQATTAEANPDGNLDRGFRIMLDSGKKVFCDAVDDFHRGDNMENRGWQMVFANSRTKQSIWNGLLMGSSYASTGVYLNDVSFVDGVFRLDIADGTSAVTTFYGYNNEVLGTSNGSTAIYEVTGDEKYVRAMVVIDGKKAWTQPIWIIAVGEQYEF